MVRFLRTLCALAKENNTMKGRPLSDTIDNLPLMGPMWGRKSNVPSLPACNNTSSTNQLVNDRNRSISIRESGRNLPAQFFWSWLSGVQLQESTSFQRTPLVHVLDSVGGFLGAMVIGHLALKSGGLWVLLVLPAMLIALGRARKMHMTIVHQAVHDQLFQIKNAKLRKAANRVVADLFGVLIWIPDFPAYRGSHAVSHHNPRETATPKDSDGREVFTLGMSRSEKARLHSSTESVDPETATPLDQDGKEVFSMGFLPGKPREHYWRLMWRLIRSPKFYVADFVKRFRYSLFEAPSYRRLASFIFVSGILGVAAMYSAWPTLLLLYVLPVFPLFRLSGLLQVLSEHFWGTHMDLIGDKERISLVCQGRFLFDPRPDKDLPFSIRVRATFKWWLRIPYHLLVRICVLCGDLQVHNDHHFHSRSPEWADAIGASSRHIRQDKEGLYTHAWSLGEALDRVFNAMASAPPLDRNWLKELED